MVTSTAGNIRPVRIEEEMRSSYLDYAMSVIVARALPDVRDGLKPVQRRILYAMHELGLRPNSPYKKCARIVGEVLGKYHPHGDAPVYEALVRMAQDFSMGYPLVDGQGNFGSVDEDPPAAMRYTEARLAAVAEEMLADIERETVDFTPNFDGSLMEPTVLPARLPNLLVNGASGIAVGMATSIPPHNLGEVCDAICLLIGNPDATADDLMAFVRGPDFPTAGIIYGMEGVRNAYFTGHGRAVVRARTAIEETKGGKRQIVVTEIPYQVNKAALVERIAELAKEKKIEGIADVRDESDRDGIRMVVELRRDAQAEPILNNLFKHTAMQSAFPINMLALVDGQPRVIGLKGLLQQYILFRQRVVTRRAEFELRKARARVHILEGLLIALANLDAVIALIRSSPDADAARQGLMARFGLSHEQAVAILDMQLRRLAALEREKIDQEYRELMQRIGELEELLADPAKVLALIKEETLQLKEKFSRPRRTEIVAEEAPERTVEELTPHQTMVIMLSQRGYIKCIPYSTYRMQHRGGKGSRGQPTREGDTIRHLLIADTHDVILFFTTRGRVYSLRGFQMTADSSKATRGTPLVNFFSLVEKEQISAVLAVPSLQHEGQLLMATRRGEIKRMELRELANIRSSGLLAMDLEPKDELITVRLASADDDVIMVTRQGMGIRFRASQAPLRSRMAGGVKGIRLEPQDEAIAMEVTHPQGRILILSRRGYGKLTPVTGFPRQGRGGLGVRSFKVVAKTGLVAAATMVVSCREITVCSAKGMVFRTGLDEIPVLGRATQGVMVMGKLQQDDEVSSVACLEDGAEEETPSVEPPAAKGRRKTLPANGSAP